jgi:hypothetical protein
MFNSRKRDKKPQNSNHGSTNQQSEQATYNKNISFTRYAFSVSYMNVESSNKAQLSDHSDAAVTNWC